jgi:hypothetical protein
MQHGIIVLRSTILFNTMVLTFASSSEPASQEVVPLLLKQAELALLGLVASLNQALQSLLASRVLLPGNNAALLSLHQVLACQPTTCVLGRSVVDLSLCPYSGGALARAARAARSRGRVGRGGVGGRRVGRGCISRRRVGRRRVGRRRVGRGCVGRGGIARRGV